MVDSALRQVMHIMVWYSCMHLHVLLDCFQNILLALKYVSSTLSEQKRSRLHPRLTLALIDIALTEFANNLYVLHYWIQVY